MFVCLFICLLYVCLFIYYLLDVCLFVCLFVYRVYTELKQEIDAKRNEQDQLRQRRDISFTVCMFSCVKTAIQKFVIKLKRHRNQHSAIMCDSQHCGTPTVHVIEYIVMQFFL